MTSRVDAVGATGDPGDETARRYAYQWTYAAILCCMLLDETEDTTEVFCEHHEDVLLKHKDGTFSGIQVKTRDTDQDVWRTSDEGLRAAFVKFARLERDFPGQFRRFAFLTNHPLHAGQNGMDICHVLAEISKAADNLGLTAPVLKFLSRVAKDAGCSEDVAFAALRKATANADLPRRRDVEGKLVATIVPVWARAADCSHASVVRAAKSLVQECTEASSLAHEGLVPAYLPLSTVAHSAVQASIESKRLTRERVLRVLESGYQQTAALEGDPAALAGATAGSTALLRAKLDTGGFSITSINSAEDLRNKADYLSLVWTKKHGEHQGVQRQHHIRSIVHRDAADAYEATKSEDQRFGPRMLGNMRTRLQTRRHDAAQRLYDCSNEHLEGFAYSLTAECQILWSTDRPWEVDK